ncbi:MAG TPA: hypothetical protein VEW28_06200 [Candidatus Kapabacteria bacterium]|nr:hypothetical protein [Candidatus Kapabacteria bacterium]
MDRIHPLNRLNTFFISLLFASVLCLLGACSSPHSISKTGSIDMTNNPAIMQKSLKTSDIKYVFRYRMISSTSSPNDDLFIDSTGQMTFHTTQKTMSGEVKTPTGFAYLEPADGDTLYYFIRQNLLYDIDPNNVNPQCPTGDIFSLYIYRCDSNKSIRLQTNTCAQDFNLLTGPQRKLFQQLIPFVQRLAARYRPGFTIK